MPWCVYSGSATVSVGRANRPIARRRVYTSWSTLHLIGQSKLHNVLWYLPNQSSSRLLSRHFGGGKIQNLLDVLVSVNLDTDFENSFQIGKLLFSLLLNKFRCINFIICALWLHFLTWLVHLFERVTSSQPASQPVSAWQGCLLVWASEDFFYYYLELLSLGHPVIGSDHRPRLRQRDKREYSMYLRQPHSFF